MFFVNVKMNSFRLNAPFIVMNTNKTAQPENTETQAFRIFHPAFICNIIDMVGYDPNTSLRRTGVICLEP